MKPGSRSFLLIVCFLAPSPEPHGSHDVDLMDASQSLAVRVGRANIVLLLINMGSRTVTCADCLSAKPP